MMQIGAPPQFNQRWLFLLLLLLLNSSLAEAQKECLEATLGFIRGRVFFKRPDKEPANAVLGNHRLETGSSLITFLDGQCFLQLADTEIRLKQETILALPASQSCELRQGLAGFRVATEPLLLKTPHLTAELANVTLVVKVNPVLTRLCVLKGHAKVCQGRQHTEVTAEQEIAAAAQRLSKCYRRSDELRFTWYWLAPDREPSLQTE